MKKSIKLPLALLVFLSFLCLMAAIWHIRSKQDVYVPNPIRPEDFPEILVAPEGAVSLDYSTPSNSKRAPHTYRLIFIIHDPYPSQSTWHFIKEHLRSNGWKHLKYHLLNPDVPAEYPNVLLYSLYKDTNKLDEYKKDKPGWLLTGMEDWLNKNDENISFFWQYKRLNKQVFDPNRLCINMTLYERGSWVYPRIVRYKELHPEEFGKSNSQSGETEKH